jgi:hypothetical protein
MNRLAPSCLLAACAAAFPVAAQDQRIVVPLTDPSRPVRLDVNMHSGLIEVTGYDGKEVVVVASSESQRYEPRGEAGGMKRIPNTALGLSVEEQANHVEIQGEWHSESVTLKVQVPVRTSASIHAIHGDIVVRGLNGEHELQGTNGGIEATGMRGSVVAGTTNGQLIVTFAEITPNKAMSFTTLNGNVDVSFPAGLKADLRIDAPHPR